MRSSAEVHIGEKRDRKLTREIQICYGEVVMQKKAWLPIKIILTLLVFLASPRTASAYYTNMPASVVIGQPDFTSNMANQGGTTAANSLTFPEDVALNAGKLFIADRNNNRILIYTKIPTSSNASANVVIGQPNFSSGLSNQGGLVGANTINNPNGIFSRGSKVIVPDTNNNRVLIFNSIPTSNNAAADVVIGQQDFSTNSANQGGVAEATNLKSPRDAYIANNKLLIADTGNNRVLVYNTIPTSNNAAADVVIGQPDFGSTLVNQGGSVGANTLNNPQKVYFDGQRLYISDSSNNRVLVFNNIPTSNNSSADFVIGQPDFVTNSAFQDGRATANSFSNPWNVRSDGKKLFVSDQDGHRILIFNSIPTSSNPRADIVVGQPDFNSSLGFQSGNSSLPTQNSFWAPRGFDIEGNMLAVADLIGRRVMVFDNYESVSTPGFTVNYPPESSGEKMRLTGNIVMGEYGKFDLRSPEVSINNQGFGPLTNFSKRQHSDHETITEFYHDFEPWAGVAPKDQWNEGDGFTAHFKATSYQSRIETQEAFLFWPFTLDSVSTEGAVPTFSFHIPSKNVEHIKSNLDRFEVYIGKEGNFSKYLKRVPINLVGEDGRVTVSGSSEGVQTAQATFLPGEYEVKVRAFDKWGNHFDSNAIPLILTQALVSVESTPLFSGFWFPLQINRATGINTGIISSFRPESVKGSYATTTLTPTFTGIAFADSLITMTVVNNQNPGEVKTFTATTSPDSTFSLTPTLYPDSAVSITAQKASLSASLSLLIRLAASN